MLSIVIPVYNESKAVGETVRRCVAEVASLDIAFEVIAVNDCSTDETGSILDACGDALTEVVVVHHPVNAGYGRALKSGIEKARFDVICILDADATYDPKYVPDFYRSFSKGLDLLIGQRSGTHFRGNIIKHLMRSTYAATIKFVVGRTIPDANSGLRVFRKSQILPYFPHLCNGFSFTTSQTLIMCLEGYFVKFEPIDYPVRAGESKVRLFQDSLRTLQFITQIIIRYNPLKLYLALIILFALVAVGGLAAGLGGFAAGWIISFASWITVSMLGVGSIVTYAITSKSG